MIGDHLLSVTDHPRDGARRRYVYPVVSRRSRGVSVGVNLSPNHACNWHCRYCQVPDLVRGRSPAIDLELLEREIGAMLGEILHGDFLRQRVPERARRLNDVAFSGNGEPTNSPSFAPAVEVVLRCLESAGQLGRIKIVVITNGSLVGKAAVRGAFERLSANRGEIWFKLDAVTDVGLASTNRHGGSAQAHLRRLEQAARCCRTWVQTCMFELDGEPPPDGEIAAYLEALACLRAEGVPLAGVQLYSLARPVLQPDAARLGPVAPAWLRSLGARVEQLGLAAVVTL